MATPHDLAESSNPMRDFERRIVDYSNWYSLRNTIEEIIGPENLSIIDGSQRDTDGNQIGGYREVYVQDVGTLVNGTIFIAGDIFSGSTGPALGDGRESGNEIDQYAAAVAGTGHELVVIESTRGLVEEFLESEGIELGYDHDVEITYETLEEIGITGGYANSILEILNSNDVSSPITILIERLAISDIGIKQEYIENIIRNAASADILDNSGEIAPEKLNTYLQERSEYLGIAPGLLSYEKIMLDNMWFEYEGANYNINQFLASFQGGNYIYDPNQNVILSGISEEGGRTYLPHAYNNFLLDRAMQENGMDIEIVTIPGYHGLRDIGALHLDLYIMPLPNGTIMVPHNDERISISPEGIETLTEIYGAENIRFYDFQATRVNGEIAFDDSEMLSNLVVLGDTVIAPNLPDDIRVELETDGFQVRIASDLGPHVDWSIINGGGVNCMTSVLQPVIQNELSANPELQVAIAMLSGVISPENACSDCDMDGIEENQLPDKRSEKENKTVRSDGYQAL